MQTRFTLCFGVALLAVPAHAQNVPGPAARASDAASATPTLSVDADKSRHAISPYIYGINYNQNLIRDINPGIIRWGGDATSQYNWQQALTNSGDDWYYTAAAQSPTFEQFFEVNHAAGVATIGTIPINGWVSDSSSACGFSIKKYGPQQCTNPYNADCGNGTVAVASAGAAPQTQTCNDGTSVTSQAGTTWKPLSQVTQTDPTDADVQVDPSFMQNWVASDAATYGAAADGGVAIWQLDNEPIWWSSVHQNIHPDATDYDEVWQKGLAHAQAIKAADPSAKVAGPITSGWYDLFFSRLDVNTGWATPPYEYWDNPVDRKAHGDLDFVAWYLQQFANYEKQNGQRLLDYFDVHGYMPGTGGDATDAASNAARLESTRVFWDESYTPPGTNEYILNTPTSSANLPPNPCVCLIPRMKNWVNTYYPGTKLTISEYILGAQYASDVNGALAQADLLGIFGREGVDVALMWPERYPNLFPTDVATYAFRLYRNYDGANSTFGDIGVSAVSTDQSQLSIYAALRKQDYALTIIVINKTANDLTATVSLGNYEPHASAAVYRYSGANLGSIVSEPKQPVTPAGFNATFPAFSATLYVLADARKPTFVKPR